MTMSERTVLVAACFGIVQPRERASGIARYAALEAVECLWPHGRALCDVVLHARCAGGRTSATARPSAGTDRLASPETLVPPRVPKHDAMHAERSGAAAPRRRRTRVRTAAADRSFDCLDTQEDGCAIMCDLAQSCVWLCILTGVVG